MPTSISTIISTRVHTGNPLHPINLRRYYTMSITFEETRNFIKQQQDIITKLRTQLNSFYGTHPQLPADTIIGGQQPVIWNREE